MKPRIAITGHAAGDYGYPHAHFRHFDQTVEIILPSVTFRVSLLDKFQGGKAPAIIPDELWRHAADLRYGGGGVQSACAAKLAAPDVGMRYLEACRPTELLQRQLSYPGLDVEFLNLRVVPRNAILGGGSDRIILKSRLEGAPPFGPEELRKLDWLTEAPCVLANSVKDDPVIGHLAQAAEANRIRLHVVVTKSLETDFARKAVLGAAHMIFASADEIGFLVGRKVTCDPAEALEALDWLRRHAAQATLYLTLGREGVLVAGPGLDSPRHVRLAQRPWEQVQERVGRDSTKLCGAGDAFAAGVTVHQQTGKSLLAGAPPSYAPELNAALAGCALAVRWIGWEPPLSESDFIIKKLSWPTRAAAAA